MTANTNMRIAAVVLIIIYAAVLLAGFVAPYDPAEQDRNHPFAPPSRVHLVDVGGKFHLRPFTYGWSRGPGGFAGYEEDGRKPLFLRLLGGGSEYVLLVLLSRGRHSFGLEDDTRPCISGSAGFCRDRCSR